MDPFYFILFLGFGLGFGITGTLIVYAARYLPVDRRVAGMVVFFCGCAAKFCYRCRMPPTPGVSIPLFTTVTGFLIHPLFMAAGVLIISGLSRYHECLKKETAFSALFFTAGLTSVLGGAGFYAALRPGAGGLGAPDFAIIPHLLTGLFDTCLAAVFFIGISELFLFLQKKENRHMPER